MCVRMRRRRLNDGCAQVDRESTVRSGRSRSLWGPVDGDRFEAETAMQTSVLETAELREIDAEGGCREVAQAVSVAAAYFEDTLRSRSGAVAGGGNVWAQESLAAMLGRERAGRPAGARDGGGGND